MMARCTVSDDRCRAAVRMREADALEGLQRHPPRLQQPHGERLQRRGNAICLSLALARRTDEGQRVDGDALGNEIIRHGAFEFAKPAGARIEERWNQPVEMSQAPPGEFALGPHDPDGRSGPHGRGGEIEHDARRGAACLIRGGALPRGRRAPAHRTRPASRQAAAESAVSTTWRAIAAGV